MGILDRARRAAQEAETARRTEDGERAAAFESAALRRKAEFDALLEQWAGVMGAQIRGLRVSATMMAANTWLDLTDHSVAGGLRHPAADADINAVFESDGIKFFATYPRGAERPGYPPRDSNSFVVRLDRCGAELAIGTGLAHEAAFTAIRTPLDLHRSLEAVRSLERTRRRTLTASERRAVAKARRAMKADDPDDPGH